MEHAFRQHKAWLDQGVGPARMAVNIAAAQFQQLSFAATVRRLIEEAGLRPADVELEITESVVLHDVALIADKLAILKEAGVSVALDEFGTGYSSLAYLRRLPIDRIKIDRSLTKMLDESDADDGRTFVEAMIGLARGLRLQIIAEGIESEAQCHVLRELGITTGQGTLFADPMPAEEFESMLMANAKPTR